MEQNSQFITGSGDGQVSHHKHFQPLLCNPYIAFFKLEYMLFKLWCYTLPVDHKCRLVTKLDLSKLEQKHERNLRKINPPQNGTDG